MGKPVIAYFKSVLDSNPLHHDNRDDKDYAQKRRLFERFKKIVTTRHNPAYYTSSEELAEKLDKSLISIYRNGVNKLSTENSSLKSKIVELEEQIARLKAQPHAISGVNSPMKDNMQSLLSLGLKGFENSATDSNQLGGLASLFGKNKT